MQGYSKCRPTILSYLHGDWIISAYMVHSVDRSHARLSTLHPNEGRSLDLVLLSDVALYLLSLILLQMLEDLFRKEPLRRHVRGLLIKGPNRQFLCHSLAPIPGIQILRDILRND
jgi:hypothetical protein